MGRTDEVADLEAKANEGGQSKKRILAEGDDCPICYEAMHDVDVKTLTFCEECGNALHTECFNQCRFLSHEISSYRKHLTGARTAKPLTCVWCRAKWAVVASAAGGNVTSGPSTSEGYLNLGAVAGVSPVRDTSTCKNLLASCLPCLSPVYDSDYNGPRRGHPGGYRRSYYY